MALQPSIPFPILSLPPELVRAVLAYLNDFRDLLAVSSSCRALQSHAHGSRLADYVLRSQAGPHLLPELSNAWNSLRIPRPYRLGWGAGLELYSQLVHNFLSRLQNRQDNQLPALSFSSAASLARLDFIITDLTEEFISDCAASWLLVDASDPPRTHKMEAEERPTNPKICPATDEERARISRAFYHVDTFFNLFSAIPEYWPDREGDGQRRLCELQETFMCLFSPVEREQLTCIVEFLWRKVSTGTPYESLSLIMCPLTGD